MPSLRGIRFPDDHARQISSIAMDSFYTPRALADLLVWSCKNLKPKRIVDFAAGDGALLKSALSRWPNADITAMDVDENAIRTLKGSIPGATLLHQDFFLFSENCGDIDVHNSDASFDVILLNPPFSCRGNTTITANIDDQTIRGSRALAFVARALPYIREDGELIAILPSSCLTSERDGAMRVALQKKWEIMPIGTSKSYAFPKCSVKIDVIRVTRRSSDLIASTPVVGIPDISRGRLQIMRGTIPNSNAATVQEGLQFVHSTDLIEGAVAQPTRWTIATSRIVSGTALMLPRVGRPKIQKIVLKSDPTPVVLSDCVVAIKTPDRRNESALYELVHRNWETFSRLWTGSCAPYLTMRGLTHAFEQLGYEVELVIDMAIDQRTEIEEIDVQKQSFKTKQQLQRDINQISATA